MLTGFEVLFQEGYQVVFFKHQLPVQIRDGEVRQRAQTLDHEFLVLVLTDLSCKVSDVILQEKPCAVNITTGEQTRAN